MRGAWIEIKYAERVARSQWSRAPCGARGLKLLLSGGLHGGQLVAPHAGRVD